MKRIALAFAAAEVFAAACLALAGFDHLVPVAITLALWLAAWSAVTADDH
jgi:hypothetical protein